MNTKIKIKQYVLLEMSFPFRLPLQEQQTPEILDIYNNLMCKMN